jgi:hypothetical protein
MNDKFKAILNGLPKKRQRSKLEPYTELIDGLRRRGHTYRDVKRILAETCDLIVVSSTLVRFVAARSKEMRKPSKFQEDKKACTKVQERIVVNPSPDAPDDDVWKIIEELKQRPAQTIAPAKQFEYDPDQPLRLLGKLEETKPVRVHSSLSQKSKKAFQMLGIRYSPDCRLWGVK